MSDIDILERIRSMCKRVEDCATVVSIWAKTLNKATKAAKAFNKACEDLRKRRVIK